MKKKNYVLIVLALVFSTNTYAQSWQTVGTGFLNSGDIATNLQVLSYADTGFVAYADMNTVVIKKNSGNGWITVGTYPTENNYFKLLRGVDYKPLFVKLSRGQADVGTTGFYADIYLYENGAMTLSESRLLEFAPDNQVSNLQVSNFDFAAKPDGSMAAVIRFPNTARSVYNVKIGSNPWFVETIFYEAIGGTSGNAIERSKLIFNDAGVVVVSKLFNQSLGVAHIFLHNETSSSPTASYLKNAVFSVGSGVDPIKITAKADTAYAVIRDPSSWEILWKFYYDPINAPTSATVQIINNYGSNAPNVVPHFTENENYLGYFEPNFSSNAYVAIVSDEFTISSAMNLGDEAYTMGESVVSPSVYDVNPQDGNVYVAYIHGPPMTQSKLRKFGCATAAGLYNATNNTLSVSSNHSTNATYAWSLCGNSAVLSTDNSFQPQENGEYQVTVTDGSCTMTSLCIQVEISGSQVGLGQEQMDKLAISPNPAEQLCKITFGHGTSQIVIYDVFGKVIHRQFASNGEVNIDLSDWKPGVYFVKMDTALYSQTAKLIKQ